MAKEQLTTQILIHSRESESKHGTDRSLLKPQSPPVVAHILQQGHIS